MVGSDAYLSDGGNVVMAVGPILVQVRGGALTRDVIDRIASLGGLVRASNRGRLGFLAVMEVGAPMPTEEANLRQREVIKRFSEKRIAPIAIVNMEESVMASVSRVRSREYARQGASIHFARDIEDAARWLAAEIDGVDVDAVIAAVEAARRELSEG